MNSSAACSANGSGSLWSMTNHSSVTTFIGAGGKTTCLQVLTDQISSAGREVVATTTTKVYPEEHIKGWRSIDAPPRQKDPWFWYDCVEPDSGKWLGPSITAVDHAIAKDLDMIDSRAWVIEGDGARGHKLKCWESYEPQIPQHTDCAVLVLGRELWGQVLKPDHVHRFYLCKDLLGQVWEADTSWRYFLRSPIFHPQYAPMSWVILLNGPGKTISNKQSTDPLDPLDLLHFLNVKWSELKQNNEKIVDRKPRHLRLAAGDVKEELLWSDLW